MGDPIRSDSKEPSGRQEERLLAGLAHELRNGLFGITASLDAFEARFEGDEEAGKYAAALRKSLNRLNAFAEELGELGESGPGMGTELDPEAIWREASEVRRARGARPVELQGSEAISIQRMRGDGRVLRNLWEQLQDLACLGGNPNPNVELDLEHLDGRRRFRGRVELQWSAPDQDPERIFEPFHLRLEGMGRLALPLLRRRLEALGGDIRAEVGNDGWRLVFTLPTL